MNSSRNQKCIQWPNSKLEPVLITYNRAKYVERTLRTFVGAGLGTMRLHVLDNASTDRTPEVVADCQRIWPELKYHRNKYNIGGNGNILRSVEIADSEYHWVIGDDDEWHLESVNELISVLESGEPDIIRLGWLVSEAARGRVFSASELAQNEAMFYASLSMISATIIRRDVIAKYLPHSYLNAGDLFPQLVPVIKGVEEMPLIVYTLSSNLMLHTPNEEPGFILGDLEFYAAWFRSSRFVRQPSLRAKFVQEIMDYVTRDNAVRWKRWRQLSRLIRIAVQFKTYGVDQSKYLLSMLAYGRGWRARLIAVLLLYSILPGRLGWRIWDLYHTLIYKTSVGDPEASIPARREQRL